MPLRSRAPNDDSLVDVLDEQIRAAEAMLGTLETESQALLESNSETLQTAGADKARLVETLESLEHERRDLADILHPELSAADGDEASVRWKRFLGLIEECRRRNQRNGILVKARREQVLEALKILRGTELQLYDATGLKPSTSGVNPLGSA